MPYTVWSRGRLIGHTDLGFRRAMRRARCGWFLPTPEGERVMPVISAVSPALRAFVHREPTDAPDESPEGSALRGRRSTQYADLAEAMQHVEALALELRRDDGSVVQVADIAIQDTQQLVELARLDVPDDAEEDWDLDDGLFPTAVFQADLAELDAGLEEVLEAELDDELGPLPGEDEPFADLFEPCTGEGAGWVPDESEEDAAARAATERYQVLVLLFDEDAIP
jgi:hypothetical protein